MTLRRCQCLDVDIFLDEGADVDAACFQEELV